MKLGFFTSSPMLIATANAKHFPEALKMQKVHLQQQHIVHAAPQRFKEVSVNVEDMKNITYTDQTGKVPVVLSKGNWYMMVIYERDGNLIIVDLMKTRKSGKMCKAYN